MKKNFPLLFSACLLLIVHFSLAQPRSPKPVEAPPPADASSGTMHYTPQNLRIMLETYESTLKDDPKNIDALFGKANCEYMLKNPRKAILSLHQSIRLDPEFASSYALLGKIMRGFNKLDSAAICYELAYKYEKDKNKKVEYKSFIVLKLIKDKKFEDAYKSVKELYAIAPTNKNVVFYYAKLSNNFSKHHEAKQAIRAIEPEIAKMDIRESVKYYYELGFAHYQLQEYEEAKPILHKANLGPFKRSVEKLSAPYFYNLATHYAKFHETDQSFYYLDHAVRIDKDFTKAYVLKAELSKRNQEAGEAVQHYEAALKNQKDPLKRLAIYDKIADLQLDAGEYEAALATLNEALRIKVGNQRTNHVDPDTWFLMCVAQYKLGNYKEAILAIEDYFGKRIPMPALVQGSFQALKGLAAKASGDNKVAREIFKMVLKTPLRDVAEAELTKMNELKAMEDEEDGLINPDNK